MFSQRVPADLTPNRLTIVLQQAKASGDPIIDITETNPTRAGIAYPASLLAPLATAGGLRYDPHPFGLLSAREAVSEEYARAGVDVGPERVVLTASTSEAYSFLFKLLCDPGDEVLVPVPSYPLFDHLSRLDGVGVRPYPLHYHGTWSPDPHEMETLVTGRTRAILLVSPNNPTGSLLGAGELVAIAALCARRGLALVGDEVFADYILQPRADRASVLQQDEALTFALGGLSKSAGLPQLKLGWIGVGGPRPLVQEAMGRLEVIADAYLSVATPVQLCAGALIAAGRGIRRLVLERIEANLAALVELAAAAPSCSVLRAEGGWSVVLRVPATRSEEDLVLELLEQDRVLVHPGYFFDFPREAYVVLSLLPEPAAFREGARRLLDRTQQTPRT